MEILFEMIVFPNCKINLGLYVTQRREDGFHNLETVFYPIPLYDVLEIIPSQGAGNLSVSGLEVAGSPADNLVVRACALLQKAYHLPAVDIHLHKVIPMGAGLGGGSADAAFALKAMNDLFELNLSDLQLMEYARQLGSDCAFFIRNKPVFAHQRGDHFIDVEIDLQSCWLAIVKPPVHVSTPDAFRRIVPQVAAFNLRNLAALPLEAWKETLVNDFEAALFPVHPEIEAIKQRLRNCGADYVAMSGSGSAVFALWRGGVPQLPEFSDCFSWVGQL